MRRLLFYLFIAERTFAFGVTIALLWQSFTLPARFTATEGPKGVFFMSYWLGLEDIYPNEESYKQPEKLVREVLFADGYTLETQSNSATEKNFATLKKRGRVVKRFYRDEIMMQFTFRRLLGKKTSQLEVNSHSGGAHCCESYQIYDLSPNFRLVFDSDKYQIGDGEHQFADLDHNGLLEIIDQANTFAYFDACYASSSFPRVVFQYDRARGQYLPANRKFQSYVLRGLNQARRRIQLYRQEREKDLPENYDFSAVKTDAFDVFLGYLYTGRRREAWRYYEREGDNLLSPKQDILRQLETDNYYQAVTRRP
jgi:hypothetical protein